MKSFRLLPALLALLRFATGYGLASRAYELHRDEYLYLDYGRHLAWGYLEVPPLTALQSWLTLALGGNWFWVKFWPLLWGSLTIYLVGRAVQRLGGGPWAVALAGLSYLLGAYARLNFLFQPNSFEVLAFTAVGYWLICYVQQPAPRWLYAIGAMLGLALLNKYSALFYIAALVAALLLTPLRRVLATRPFWLAVGLALLLWLPNLAWQIGHGLPVRHHMALLRESQLVHVSVAGFWQSQAIMNVLSLWVWVPGLLALLLSWRLQPYRALGLVYVAGLLLLTLLHGKDYYALGYYPLLLAAGAAWWQQWLSSRPRLGQVLRPALLGLPLALSLRILPLLFTTEPPAGMLALGARYQKLGVLRWEDGRDHPLPQDFADMLGWRELAAKTHAAYAALPAAAQGHTFILTDNYGQAGAINYYNRRHDLPPANSFNGSYLFWQPPTPPGGWQYILLVEEEPTPGLEKHFQTLQTVGEVRNPYARERGTRIRLGFQPDTAILAYTARRHRRELAAWGQF
ncbi:glycosyltransferase family 39 protein [Hymenobacter actinosclerus]|uniref:Dolichyl-phosphate-mannose-protein mannosyltransferase n=1 Tax=Hymenobacter actinosclerus TaxID=82805 RepID=A0A1I0FC83_9BACT|nr:glycosyltransferase family 39 protein [Hymenobacter actinosclerus]SET55742.1 Dolichyl-phosphate-mannose-protein mannosyltransferase [Hymenobacter actinosclerus]